MSPLRSSGLFPPAQRSARPGVGVQAEAHPLPVLDLLRERRETFGQRPIWPLLDDRRSLVLQGATLGAGLFGVVLAITALVFLRLQLIRTEIGRYSQVEAQNAAVTAQLGTLKQTNKQVQEENTKLTQALTDVRPTSALLADLQLRVPRGIQLQTATTTGNTLVLTGLAEEPASFSHINALELELRRSPLFLPDQVILNQVERTSAAPNGNATAGSNANSLSAPAVKFTMTATFAELKPSQMQDVLNRLGASGMARRFEVMRQEGLIQ